MKIFKPASFKSSDKEQLIKTFLIDPVKNCNLKKDLYYYRITTNIRNNPNKYKSIKIEDFAEYWQKNPDAYFTPILEEYELVIDTDSAEASKTIEKILHNMNIKTLVIESTTKGNKHYFFKTPIKHNSKRDMDLKIGNHKSGQILGENSLVFGCPFVANRGIGGKPNGEPVYTLNMDELMKMSSFLINDNVTFNNITKFKNPVIKNPQLTKVVEKLGSSEFDENLWNYIKSEIFPIISNWSLVDSSEINEYVDLDLPLARGKEGTNNNHLMTALLYCFARYADVSPRTLLDAMRTLDDNIFDRPLREDGKFSINPDYCQRILDQYPKREVEKIDLTLENTVNYNGVYVGLYDAATSDENSNRRLVYKVVELENGFVKNLFTVSSMITLRDLLADRYPHQSSKFNFNLSEEKFRKESNLLYSFIFKQSNFYKFNKPDLLSIRPGGLINLSLSSLSFSKRLTQYESLIKSRPAIDDEEFETLPIVKFVRNSIFPNKKIFYLWLYTLKESILHQKPLQRAFMLAGEGGIGKTPFVSDFLRRLLLNVSDDEFDEIETYKPKVSPYFETTIKSILKTKWGYPYLSKLLFFDELGLNGGNFDEKTAADLNEVIKRYVKISPEVTIELKNQPMRVVRPQFLGLYLATNSVDLKLRAYGVDNTRLIVSACRKSEYNYSDCKPTNEELDTFLIYLLTNDNIDRRVKFMKLTEREPYLFDDSSQFEDDFFDDTDDDTDNTDIQNSSDIDEFLILLSQKDLTALNPSRYKDSLLKDFLHKQNINFNFLLENKKRLYRSKFTGNREGFDSLLIKKGYIRGTVHYTGLMSRLKKCINRVFILSNESIAKYVSIKSFYPGWQLKYRFNPVTNEFETLEGAENDTS